MHWYKTGKKVLFSAVDAVANHSSVIKQKWMHLWIAKSIRVVGRDIKFANNFITSWSFPRLSAVM